MYYNYTASLRYNPWSVTTNIQFVVYSFLTEAKSNPDYQL